MSPYHFLCIDPAVQQEARVTPMVPGSYSMARMKTLRRLLPVLAMLLCHVPLALAQMVPARVISSIDVKVLSQRTVIVGTITKAVSGDNGSIVLSVAVQGQTQSTVYLHLEPGKDKRLPVPDFSRLVRDKTPVVVIGDAVLELDSHSLAVPTATGEILRDPKKVTEYIRDISRTHPGSTVVDSFDVPLPNQFEKVEWSPLFDNGMPGSPRALAVPVDARLEKWAIDAIRSGTDYSRAFSALGRFKSDENAAFLKTLFDNPKFDVSPAKDNNGVEIRTYIVRRSSYDLLRNWNVAVDPPVLREEIPRFETLEAFNWSIDGNVIDDRLRKAAELSRNLKQFVLGNGAHPSAQQVELIARMTSMTSLRVSGPDKTDTMLSTLAKLPNLEEVTLRTTRITDKGLASLTSLSKLRSIDLVQTRVTDDGLRQLAQIRSLKTINVALTHVTQKGVAEVRAGRPDLEIIWFSEPGTGIHELAQHGDLDRIRQLFRTNNSQVAIRQPNLMDLARNTPLMYAVAQNHIDVATYLLDAGAGVDAQDIGNATPLLWATRHGYPKMMELLLDRGANVNHRDEDGNTAMHFAVEAGNLEEVGLLLARGANVRLGNNNGETALNIALRRNNQEIIGMLTQAGSRGRGRGGNRGRGRV